MQKQRVIYEVVPPNERRTSNIMSLYEYTEVVSVRASHLNEDPSTPVFTDTKGCYDVISIAKKEIAERRCPFIIQRKVSETKVEHWAVNEMELPELD